MRILHLAAAVMIAAALSSSSAATHQSFRKAEYNLLNSISPPTDPFAREVAERLKASLVPAAKDAERAAREVFLRGSALDARDSVAVTGLYLLAHDVPELAKENELIWEVRMFRVGHLSRLAWVSASTKTVKVLFTPT